MLLLLNFPYQKLGDRPEAQRHHGYLCCNTFYITKSKKKRRELCSLRNLQHLNRWFSLLVWQVHLGWMSLGWFSLPVWQVQLGWMSLAAEGLVVPFFFFWICVNQTDLNGGIDSKQDHISPFIA